MNFLERLKGGTLVFDGAMGTLLLDKGIKPGACLEELNLTDALVIRKVHEAYVNAGADIIETNCFGGNRIKLSESALESKVVAINSKGVEIAREAAGSKALVAGNIGPTGKLLKPMGELTFDEAYDAFAQQAKIFKEAGADLISIETMTDIQELRAAVMAVKENTDLPVIASMTFEDNGVTITGTPPEVFVLVAEAVGADVIGANCSNGPKVLIPVMEKIARHSSKPIFVAPNAGFPRLVNGRAVYDMTPEVFADYAEKFLKMGVNIIGGCCGTAPEHIRKVREIVNSVQRTVCRKIMPISGFASRTKVVEYGQKVLLIGERINPTGRKALQEEIKASRTSMIKSEAAAQEKAGAQLIDVNVGVPDVDDVSSMSLAVEAVSLSVSLPICLDSPKATVLLSGLKSFPGKPLLNSVSGKEESLKSVLPLIKRFGAAFIGLCLDEKGIPDTAEGRLLVAKKIVDRALELKIPKENIFIDALVMTAGVGADAPLLTLKAMKLVKEGLKVKTVLGISNVSHGMPHRSKLNSIYLQLALLYGVDAVIVDPTDRETMKALKAKTKAEAPDLIEEFKRECEKWKGLKVKGKGSKEEKRRPVAASLLNVRNSVIAGDKDGVFSLVTELIKKKANPKTIIDKALVPAMENVGRKFSKGVYYLPQVISSAEAMKAGFELVKSRLKGKHAASKGSVVLATVRGDIHDIGKNIVKMMLENNGFNVIDLGKDVPTETIIAAVKSKKARAVALSALLTTTMPEMEAVKKELLKEGIDIPVLIGGAVVTKEYASRIGATYGKDAVLAVDLVSRIIKGR
jgi:5-methyltetrahydrofolate--homocysteine methyltransferase